MSDDKRTTWQTGRIVDARGRAVSQLDPVLMHLRREHGVIPAGPLGEIAEEIGFGMTRANRVTFWAGLVGLACLGIGVTILSVRLAHGTVSTRRFIGSLIPLTAVWVTIHAFWMGTRGVRFTRIKRVMLARGFCPHCGYSLGGLAPNGADGATVCPECGCAWRLGEG